MYQELDKFYLKVDQRLSLVAPQMHHALPLFELIKNERPYLKTWLSWVEKTQTLQDVKRFIREAQAFNEGGQRLTTFLNYQNQIVGSVGFVRLNMRHKKGEIGYWLSKDHQGKGITTLSCFKFIDFAFRELQLHRIEIRVLSKNEKSKGIPLRLGFQHEGQLRQAIRLNQLYHDMDIYGMLASQWINIQEELKREGVSS